MDALEVLLLANAVVLGVTIVYFSRSLYRLLQSKALKLTFTFKRLYAIAAILAIVLVTGVYGVTLFQHTFPAAPNGNSQVISSTCTTLTLETGGMITGVPASLLFDCGASGAAITSSSGGSATPTFSLPNGATSLSLVTHVNNAKVCVPGSSLTSGSQHTFTSGESLDYCLASSSYPNSGIASFIVTWSQ